MSSIDQRVLDRIPPRYRGCTRDAWEDSAKHWKTLDRWLDDPQRKWAVAILGPAGSGKSHLGTALFLEFHARVRPWGNWMDAAQAIHQLRDEIPLRPEDRRFQRTTEQLHDERILLIDDFLADRLTPYAHDEWLYVLTQRYNHARPTIITTNAEAIEAFDALDPRVTSRLQDGLVLRLTGRDRRVPR